MNTKLLSENLDFTKNIHSLSRPSHIVLCYRQKEAEFDAQGRPYQTFFYTRKPDLQNRIYKLRDSIEAVTIFGERLAKQGKRADPQQVLDMGQMADSRWITKDELSSLTLELITDSDHREFVTVLERLVSLPFSYR